MAAVPRTEGPPPQSVPMIARSDPQRDATQFSTFLMKTRATKCREVFFGTSVTQFFESSEIDIHGTTYLELVLRKIAVFNAGLVASFSVDWIHMHPEDVNTIARAGVKPQDIFSVPMISYHGLVFLTEAMKHIRGALQRTFDWQEREKRKPIAKATQRNTDREKENAATNVPNLAIGQQVIKNEQKTRFNKKKGYQVSGGYPAPLSNVSQGSIGQAQNRKPYSKRPPKNAACHDQGHMATPTIWVGPPKKDAETGLVLGGSSSSQQPTMVSSDYAGERSASTPLPPGVEKTTASGVTISKKLRRESRTSSLPRDFAPPQPLDSPGHSLPLQIQQQQPGSVSSFPSIGMSANQSVAAAATYPYPPHLAPHMQGPQVPGGFSSPNQANYQGLPNLPGAYVPTNAPSQGNAQAGRGYGQQPLWLKSSSTTIYQPVEMDHNSFKRFHANSGNENGRPESLRITKARGGQGNYPEGQAADQTGTKFGTSFENQFAQSGFIIDRKSSTTRQRNFHGRQGSVASSNEASGRSFVNPEPFPDLPAISNDLIVDVAKFGIGKSFIGSERQDVTTLWVGSLPEKATESELLAHFQTFVPSIQSVSVQGSVATTPYAWARFPSTSEARKALDLVHCTQFKDRNIVVQVGNRTLEEVLNSTPELLVDDSGPHSRPNQLADGAFRGQLSGYGVKPPPSQGGAGLQRRDSNWSHGRRGSSSGNIRWNGARPRSNTYQSTASQGSERRRGSSSAQDAVPTAVTYSPQDARSSLNSNPGNSQPDADSAIECSIDSQEIPSRKNSKKKKPRKGSFISTRSGSFASVRCEGGFSGDPAFSDVVIPEEAIGSTVETHSTAAKTIDGMAEENKTTQRDDMGPKPETCADGGDLKKKKNRYNPHRSRSRPSQSRARSHSALRQGTDSNKADSEITEELSASNTIGAPSSTAEAVQQQVEENNHKEVPAVIKVRDPHGEGQLKTSKLPPSLSHAVEDGLHSDTELEKASASSEASTVVPASELGHARSLSETDAAEFRSSKGSVSPASSLVEVKRSRGRITPAVPLPKFIRPNRPEGLTIKGAHHSRTASAQIIDPCNAGDKEMCKSSSRVLSLKIDSADHAPTADPLGDVRRRLVSADLASPMTPGTSRTFITAIDDRSSPETEFHTPPEGKQITSAASGPISDAESQATSEGKNPNFVAPLFFTKKSKQEGSTQNAGSIHPFAKQRKATQPQAPKKKKQAKKKRKTGRSTSSNSGDDSVWEKEKTGGSKMPKGGSDEGSVTDVVTVQGDSEIRGEGKDVAVDDDDASRISANSQKSYRDAVVAK
ncbi:hypothetical protein P152DRAFT_171731 [Eremomyces bilateralis CBS 781.70]|uniref:RRM domain-containing protein n=1 Tax=Eremomyces bilateralis CBS 781.70 TaxID=1392243 RepID=A0A6G1FTF9_9PEZI|nr:uncharacterized protein P152DRAFT_171731 [Eremomyces bilateralis CBS 781.70]KAF1809165.1 hypothetical protein P152DRAFT_171731 [Eremomyces bilateralis CBS 781.70]